MRAEQHVRERIDEEAQASLSLHHRVSRLNQLGVLEGHCARPELEIL
jgi:hypothetical protein